MFDNVPIVEVAAVLAAHDFDAPARVGTFEQRNGAEHVDAIVAAERVRRHAEAVIAQHTAALFATRRRQLGTGRVWSMNAMWSCRW